MIAEKKPNKRPVALIRPDSPVRGTTGSQVVLDAEGNVCNDHLHLIVLIKVAQMKTVMLLDINGD